MITVDEALARIFALCAPLETETVALRQACGRVLAGPVAARRDQPPFTASAMDGYAVHGADVRVGASFKVIGEAPAGNGFSGTVGQGQAVRIFTGAPLPDGTDHVIIQEDADRDGDAITLAERLGEGRNVRARGSDFAAGDTLSGPRRLNPRDLALLAAMNHPELGVIRRPDVAIVATGDELVMPGETPGPDQIIASNAFGLAALAEANGARARLLPIARDTPDSLRQAMQLAAGADLIVTIGGASVGDYDLVGAVTADMGLERSFYKVAMRPGKPLMAGRLGGSVLLGLPGNPVSAMVCGHVFMLPALNAMLDLGTRPVTRLSAPLGVDIPANGDREHYMRARLGPEGLVPFERQDSALLGLLGQADALLVRAVADAPRTAGTMVDYIPL